MTAHLRDALVSAAATLAVGLLTVGALCLFAPVEWPTWSETRAMEASAP